MDYRKSTLHSQRLDSYRARLRIAPATSRMGMTVWLSTIGFVKTLANGGPTTNARSVTAGLLPSLTTIQTGICIVWMIAQTPVTTMKSTTRR